MESTRGSVRTRRNAAGFSLAEVMVALGVVGVATFIAISLFNASLGFGETSRHKRVAVQIAEEQLSAITRLPSQYDFPTAEQLSAGTPVQFHPKTQEASAAPSGASELPKALPVSRRARVRDMNLYNRFRYDLYARLPENREEPFLEVTVVVRWVEAERERRHALTSAIAWDAVEATP